MSCISEVSSLKDWLPAIWDRSQFSLHHSIIFLLIAYRFIFEHCPYRLLFLKSDKARDMIYWLKKTGKINHTSYCLRHAKIKNPFIIFRFYESVFSFVDGKVKMSHNNSKNQKIQILRGIAICAVVAIHTEPPYLFGILARSFVNFAVSMFFSYRDIWQNWNMMIGSFF